METALLRPYLPDLARWRPLIVLVALLACVVLLGLGATLVAGAAHSQPAEQLLAPFRWGPGTKIAA